MIKSNVTVIFVNLLRKYRVRFSLLVKKKKESIERLYSYLDMMILLHIQYIRILRTFTWRRACLVTVFTPDAVDLKTYSIWQK